MGELGFLYAFISLCKILTENVSNYINNCCTFSFCFCCLMTLVEEYSLDLSCRRFLTSLFCMNFIWCIRSTLNFKLPVLIQVNNIALTILMMCELLRVSSHISYFLKSEGNSVNQFNISECLCLWGSISKHVFLKGWKSLYSASSILPGISHKNFHKDGEFLLIHLCQLNISECVYFWGLYPSMEYSQGWKRLYPTVSVFAAYIFTCHKVFFPICVHRRCSSLSCLFTKESISTQCLWSHLSGQPTFWRMEWIQCTHIWNSIMKLLLMIIQDYQEFLLLRLWTLSN